MLLAVKSMTTDFPVTSGIPASTYNTIAQTTASMPNSTTEGNTECHSSVIAINLTLLS